MTLFSHILQNPLDHRAKSDAKLMNVVVNFLSLLGQDAETGGVHRMLGVCSEFERVAKSVIEKAEKEQSSKRKRKNQDDSAKAAANVPDPLAQTHTQTTNTPTGNGLNGVNDGHLSPKFNGEANRAASRNSISPMMTTVDGPSPALKSAGWPSEFPVPGQGQGQNQGGPNQQGFTNPFGPDTEMGNFGPEGLASPPPMMGAPFQQPLLPQDLFSLPMTLDWDWAEMSGGAYPSVENGNV